LYPINYRQLKMRKNLFLLSLLLTLTLPFTAHAQTICSPNGNLFVFANYDGGVLNIDVNVNIPNIKIGICTYEPTTINITGAFAGNVTEVRYAGYVATNNHHCSNSPSTTTITGVPANITSVNFLPPSTLSNPNGYSSIVCAYSCDLNTSQGGCNTADQVLAYFQSTMGGTTYSYFTQYGCWSNTAYPLSAGGTCCPTGCNIVANAGADQSMCAGAQVTLSGNATGGATTYSWSPTTGLATPNAATTTASPAVTTSYVLTATNGGVCTAQDTVVVTVGNPTASFAPLTPLCTDNGPFPLTGGQPGGGVYSGTGVSNGTFSASATGAGTFPITYTVTDGQGCTATATSNMVVNAQPVVSQTPIGPFCFNDPAMTLTTGSPAGGSYSGSGVANGIYTPAAAGVGSQAVVYYYVAPNGCSNGAVQFVTVVANPPAPVLQYVAPTLLTTAAADSIAWFFNGLPLLTNGTSIVPTQDGSYTAIAWYNGCPSDLSSPILVTIVALELGWGNVEAKVWPNPAGDELHVAMEGMHFEATLVDLLGREVRAAQAMDSRGIVSVRGLSKGVYTLRIRSEFGTTAIKVIKE
jgi:Secretion system C-terminal sorting domain